jgi:hypothetical protein
VRTYSLSETVAFYPYRAKWSKNFKSQIDPAKLVPNLNYHVLETVLHSEHVIFLLMKGTVGPAFEVPSVKNAMS